MSASVVVLQNHAEVPPAWVADAIAEAGREMILVRFDQGESLPDPAGCEAVVVLGGFQTAVEFANDPMLSAEVAFLRALVESEVPVLAICLGCQLLSAAFGGTLSRLPQPELVYGPVPIVSDGPLHPIAEVIEGAPLLSLHEDTWTVPPGATLIAATELSPQVFVIGSAVGIQPHPEISADLAGCWIEKLRGEPDPELSGRLRCDETARRALLGRILGAVLWPSQVSQP